MHRNFGLTRKKTIKVLHTEKHICLNLRTRREDATFRVMIGVIYKVLKVGRGRWLNVLQNNLLKK